MSFGEIPDVNALVRWVGDLPAVWIYLLLAVSTFLENLFPPWPSDTLAVFSGFLSAHGVLSLSWSLTAVVVGNVAGAVTMYYAGSSILRWAWVLHHRMWGPAFFRRWLLDFLSRKKMDKAEAWFAKYGFLLVLFSRFLAGIRYFVTIVAGMTRMNPYLYLVAFTLGAILWGGLLVGGGYYLGERWDEILSLMKIYNRTFLILLALGAAVYAIWKFRTFRKKSGERT